MSKALDKLYRAAVAAGIDPLTGHALLPRPDLYVVGSIVWFANGTMATQRLAEGDRNSCKKFYETAEHPLQPGDVLHPDRAPAMLCVTKAEWEGLIANAAATDAQGRERAQ